MIQPFDTRTPRIHPEARIAANATIVGDVCIGRAASVWYGAVLRGDECSICLGDGSNIQDNCVLHSDPGFPAVIGQDVTVGHGAILHGCTVEDGCLIGMGAILLNGCVIGAGSLVMGSPAKAVRPLRPEEQESLPHSAQLYRELSAAQLPAAGQEVTT